jgi:hypothetical protein
MSSEEHKPPFLARDQLVPNQDGPQEVGRCFEFVIPDKSAKLAVISRISQLLQTVHGEMF